MSFGKFHPAQNKMIKNMYGEKIPVNTPAGYAGLFWGTVYTSNGKKLESAEEYFMTLEEKQEDDELDYCDIISDKIAEYCMRQLGPLCGNDPDYHYQSGFGGDEADGLIDFWLPVKAPELPDMKFVIENKEYTLKWEYSN